MKLIYKILVGLKVILITSLLSAQNRGNDILLKSIEKMNQLAYFKISADFDFYNPATGEKVSYGSNMIYLDFTSKDTLIGAKFIDREISYSSTAKNIIETMTSVFNGREYFQLNDNKQIALVAQTLKEQRINSSLVGCFAGLRKVLPRIMDDPEHKILQQKDSTIHGVDSYVFDMDIMNGAIMGSQIYSNKTNTDIKPVPMKYKLFIGKKTMLPSTFVVYSRDAVPNYKVNIVCNFKNIEKVSQKNDKELSLEHYSKKYNVYSFQEYYTKRDDKINDLLNSVLTDFELLATTNERVTLSSIEKKYVLIEFMFVGCGPCTQATPELNKLLDDYKDRLEIVSIDFKNASVDKLKKYAIKAGMNFKVLSGGNDLAERYGIQTAPTFLLLDQHRRVIWSKSSYRKGSVTKAIERNL